MCDIIVIFWEKHKWKFQTWIAQKLANQSLVKFIIYIVLITFINVWNFKSLSPIYQWFMSF